MKRKLSKKEREELVTKGFLVDNEYITRKSLEEILDSKNYVTKDYFEARLETALTKQSQDFYQHMEALMEHQMHQLQVFMEHMDDRYVLRREWIGAKGV